MTDHVQLALDVAIPVVAVLALAVALSFRLQARRQRAVSQAVAARFAAMVEHGSDLISVTDPMGNLVYASPAYRKVLGFAPEDRIGTPLQDQVHPDDLERVLAAGAVVAQMPGGSVTLDFRYAHADGGYRWVDATLTNRVDDPAVGGYVVNTRDVTDRVLAAERLVHEATHDDLTGLPNRSLLDHTLIAATETARSRGLVAAVYVDVDHFKAVNDTLGHHVGDHLLVAVAARLRAAVRAEDTVLRLGGDEFVVITAVRGEAEARRLARAACAAFTNPFAIHGHLLDVSASVGLACATPAGDPDDLLRAADRALYTAKDQGRRQWAESPLAAVG